MPWSAIASAVGNIAGGLLNSSSSAKANKQTEAIVDANLKRQNDLTHHGIQYRAQDAMRAYNLTGIHPLALLGVQGATYSPVSAAFTAGGMGDSIARTGQDISRAISAGADRSLRADQLRLQEVQMKSAAERGQLENELLRTQIASQRMRLAQQSMPGIPNRGPVDPIVDTTRLHQGITDNIELARESSATPGIGYLKMPDGSLMPVKSKEASERLEDDWFGNIKHFVMREFGPSFWESGPGRPAKPGHRWTVNFAGNWVEVPIKTWNAPRMNWLRSRGGLSTNR